MAESEAVAKEISWLAVILVAVATLLSAPALVWATRYSPEPVAEMTWVSANALVIFAVVVYVLHLLRYNSLVRKGAQQLAEAVGLADSQPEVDWDE